MPGAVEFANRLVQCVLIVLIGAASGCTSWPDLTSPWHKPLLDAEAGLYTAASIEYRVDAGLQNLPLSIARIEGRRVSYDQVASQPQRGAATGSLMLRYPHPDGSTDRAEVRLSIDSVSRSKSSWWKPTTYLAHRAAADAIHEEWLLDVPKSDLDSILDQLRREGFFVRDAARMHAADVTVRFNGGHVHKPWSQVPVLEACMQRVRCEGQLVSLQRPSVPAHAMPLTSSVDAYHALVAQGGGGDQRAPAPWPSMAC